MVKYDLSHLTQDDNQHVWGPIQDDEALFLYSIIRASRLKRIFEIGGLSGYSAQNFLNAVNFGPFANSSNPTFAESSDPTSVAVAIVCSHQETVANEDDTSQVASLDSKVPVDTSNGPGATEITAVLTTEILPIKLTPGSVVYTCDINPVPKLAENHIVLQKNVIDVTPEDLDNLPLDLVFFDCHDEIQIQMFNSFVSKGIITDNTILALHDTNLHYAPYNKWGPFVPEENGFAHQVVERKMVNYFKEIGYDIFSIKTDSSKHSPELPVRHGISICQKFKKMF